MKYSDICKEFIPFPTLDYNFLHYECKESQVKTWQEGGVKYFLGVIYFSFKRCKGVHVRDKKSETFGELVQDGKIFKSSSPKRGIIKKRILELETLIFICNLVFLNPPPATTQVT